MVTKTRRLAGRLIFVRGASQSGLAAIWPHFWPPLLLLLWAVVVVVVVAVAVVVGVVVVVAMRIRAIDVAART